MDKQKLQVSNVPSWVHRTLPRITVRPIQLPATAYLPRCEVGGTRLNLRVADGPVTQPCLVPLPQTLLFAALSEVKKASCRESCSSAGSLLR